MIPLILELNEELDDGEEMVGVKTITVSDNKGHRELGYVAIIRNFKSRYSNDIRYGSLKAREYDKRKFGTVV